MSEQRALALLVNSPRTFDADHDLVQKLSVGVALAAVLDLLPDGWTLARLGYIYDADGRVGYWVAAAQSPHPHPTEGWTKLPAIGKTPTSALEALERALREVVG